MDIAIRSCKPDEMGLFFETLSGAFGAERDEEDARTDRWKHLLDPDRTLAAFDDDVMVATAGDFAFTMTIPGGEAPTAGVTMVGVLPSHRRRGILTGLMRRQLEAVRERGQPLALLWASEGHIYQRFGYGLATVIGAMDLDRSRAVFRDAAAPVGRTRLLDKNEALKVLPDLYERVRMATPGMVARTPEWWEWNTILDRKKDRDGGGPMFKAVWEHEGRAEAYALYRVHQKWGDEGPLFKLNVIEALAASPLGTREIWRFLFGVDLVKNITTWLRPGDDPLLLMLSEPRRIKLTLHDGVWLRIVDVQDALRMRSYAADGTMAFDLADSFCPWNEGVWELTVSGGVASIERSQTAPQLRLEAVDLASAYLGTFSFSQLRRAGRITEVEPGAVAVADALFHTDVAPYNCEIF